MAKQTPADKRLANAEIIAQAMYNNLWVDNRNGEMKDNNSQWDLLTGSAKIEYIQTALIAMKLTDMFRDHPDIDVNEPPFQIDQNVPCFSCGAKWQIDPNNGNGWLEHYGNCAWLLVP